MLWQQDKVDPRAIRVRVAKHFTRLLFALVAGRQLLRHPCAANRESLLRKLLKFPRDHHTSSEPLQAQLQAAAEQLTQPAREQEGDLLSAALTGPTRRRSPASLADLRPLILAKHGVKIVPRSHASVSVAASDAVSSPSLVPVPGASSEVTHHSRSAVGTTASNGSPLV